MAVILTLVDKTASTVCALLILMVFLSIYPIWHFFKSNMARASFVLVVVGGAIILGWNVWPNRHVDASSQQKQPAVQQTNQGNNDTNINGNNNTVTNTTIVLKRDDPKAKEQLDRIEKLLKEKKDELSSATLLEKYQGGCVMFDAISENIIIPYQTFSGAVNWKVDWATIKYREITLDGKEYFELGGLSLEGEGVVIRNNVFRYPRQPGGHGLIARGPTWTLAYEILAVEGKGTVFLLGLQKTVHKAA